MRALILVFITGCFPILSPPAHMRVGAGKASAQVPYTDYDGKRYTTSTLGEFDIGLDGSSFVETPINAESGIVTDFQRTGAYLDAGYMRRISTHWRYSAYGGGEYFFSNANGAGVRTCLTFEYVSRFKRGTDEEVDMGNDGTHDKSTTYTAQIGSFGVGLFFDAGHRWFEDGPNYTYFTMGLSIRLAALAGIIDFSESH
jgi:hypothetical protein